MNVPKVSIIIVSYNCKELLKKCVESVVNFTKGFDFEIIVVDNASTDGVEEVLKDFQKRWPNFKAIMSKENSGFSKGNNLGIKEAKGEYVLLLNPDTEFVENTLPIMHLWMETHPEVAVSSCQMLSSEHKVSPTGGYAPTLFRVMSWALFLDDLPILSKIFTSYHPHSGGVPWGNFAHDVVNSLSFSLRKGTKESTSSATETATSVYLYDREFFPDWVTGAFFFMRKSVIDQIGMLDENIFMYGEELEWCLRAKKALRPASKDHWQVGYTPDSKFIHHERGTQGGVPTGALLGEFRGLKYIYGKYEPIWKQLILGTLLDIAAFGRILFWLLRGKMLMVQIYGKALML